MPQSSFLAPDLPEGFIYRADFITPDEEQALIRAFAEVAFSRVEMRGGVARRRTAHYGFTDGYTARDSEPGPPIPVFLRDVRQRVAEWASVEADAFAEALLTEYPEGAPIGWHRDAPMFGDVAGISLGASSRMKFRPYVSPAAARDVEGPRRTTHDIELEPRSAYLMTGVARREYEHSIPPVRALRYSITFRTMRSRKGV